MQDVKLKIENEVVYLIDNLLEQVFNRGTPFTEIQKVKKSITLDLVTVFEKKRKCAQKKESKQNVKKPITVTLKHHEAWCLCYFLREFIQFVECPLEKVQIQNTINFLDQKIK